MEATKHRKINSGKEYDHLFPTANLKDETVKKGATVSDTVKFIPKVVNETLPQTERIAERLRGNTLSQTCKNIWDFVYNHIRYEKDDEGKEQIRSPARTWHDRSHGVNCDCYTVFISSILTNLKIPHSLRIAKYRKDYFQHIYPVVHKANGRYITIDCVVDYFNYEEPYTEIKDTKMDLQYLSGTDENDGADFGALFKRKKKSGDAPKKGKKGGLKQLVKKAVHVVNRANPATVLLRNGVLASMKLNLMKVGQRLKYAYLSDAEAEKRGIDMAKFKKLKSVKDKLENIFFGAGGKPENLKKAILTGKGNKKGKHDVEGLGNYGEEFSGHFNASTPLPELLGEQMFLSENEESLGQLGEPVTAASVTAATGAIAAIAALLKSIGNIFPKKDSGEAKEFEDAEKQSDNTDVKTEIEKSKDEISKMSVDSGSGEKSSGDESEDDTNKQGFWDKNKKWLKPTLWGAGGLTVLYGAFKIFGGKKKTRQLSGTGKKPKGNGKKDAVALM